MSTHINITTELICRVIAMNAMEMCIATIIFERILLQKKEIPGVERSVLIDPNPWY